MKGVFTSLNWNSYIKDVCLVYISSVNQEYRLLCRLANGVSKIPWGWMPEVFSLCLSSSPHPSPTVFSFDAVGERPATKHIQSAEQTIKSRNIALPQNTIRIFWRFPVSQGISNSTLCKPREVSNLVSKGSSEKDLNRGEETFAALLVCIIWRQINANLFSIWSLFVSLSVLSSHLVNSSSITCDLD